MVLLWWLGFVSVAAAVVWWWWWCCGGVAAVVELWWWCCGGVAVDEPVTLTCRNRDTDVVPFTYNLNGFDIQFGREEFCLITGLRFGVEYSSCYLVGRIPFRRRVFESDVDGNHITCRMLLQKIESEEFDTLNDDDAVGVCLLALLQMVLLGREPRHNVPDWYLRNAKVKWWDVLYATQNEPDSHLPKYSLTGFTWAFKGARPNRRPTPDAFEARAEWWVSSRDFFDGRIREPPRIPSRVHQHSRDEVPEDIYRHMREQDRSLKEAQSKVATHDVMLNQINVFLQGMNTGTMPGPMKGPVEVRKHYGLSDFSVFQNTQGFPQAGPKMFMMQASNSFFEGAQMTPTYPTTYDQPMSSRYPSTPHIITPIAQQGFVSWYSSYQTKVDPRPQYGPSHNRDVGGVIPDVMNRERRETLPIIFLQIPFMALPDTTVAPKTRNLKVSTFDLGNVVVDENERVEDDMIIGAHATENYISYDNVDPNKAIARVVRGDYVDCMRFLYKLEHVFLDCHIRGFRVEEQFWEELVPLLCRGGNVKAYDPNKSGWLSNDLLIRTRPLGARHTLAKSGTASMHPGSNIHDRDGSTY
ncbi:hypothetical protein Tco_0728845 [Tanacetum coccineum]|uniref:Phospholipase-like protein n=1 Tax=Tanacetum coccineum TaxID=301880 RepID=A0ABQ4YM85_9ASTR